VLLELDCDVIGLQEVVVQDGEARGDQARYLADRLGMEVVLGATRPHKGGVYGNAVLTRLPVVGVERFDLTIGSREPRGCLRVDVDVAGRTLHVHNCHLGLGVSERRLQLARLREFLRQSSGPRVLMGDFNEWYPGPVTSTLWREFVSRPPAVPRTHPALMPTFALDRLYCDAALALPGEEMRPHRSETSRVASDHLPVVVKASLQASA
jgi:endonuclease/exonuclease/phosphatase family metal-dependent hydrolase